MDYSEIYVKRIRSLCKERGIAINKLATMSDVKQSTLDNIVRGLTKNPRVKTLHKIAIAFNMTLSEFLDFKAHIGKFLCILRKGCHFACGNINRQWYQNHLRCNLTV